jgi:hypothetical protein
MKQSALFGDEFQDDSEKKYTTKINAPVYEPKNIKPHVLELYDNSKSQRLINEIKNSNITEDEKKFLIYAATRHIIFNYEKIADYYAHSNKEVQNLMERSALVIIDFEKAIQLGYVKLSEDIKSEYLTEYEQ